MAVRAGLSELSFMGVVFGMAGGALFGCAFENAIEMTLAALQRGVFALQWKCTFRMIEGGRLPIVRRVTAPTAGPELALMGVVFGMAGGTVLRGLLEGRQGGGALVAGFTI